MAGPYCLQEECPLPYQLGDSAPISLCFEEAGQPFDLTNCTLTAVVKSSLDDPDSAALITLTSGAGITLGTSTNQALLAPTTAQSAALAVRTYHLIVVIRDAANVVYTGFKGYLEAQQRGIGTPA